MNTHVPIVTMMCKNFTSRINLFEGSKVRPYKLLDLLAKAGYLKTLNDIIKHAEAFETALRDQLQLQQPNEYVAKISQYWKSKQGPPNKSKKACPGCGSTTHGPSQQSSVCPAWGKQCLNCNKYNHFAKVCRQPLTESANALIVF